MIDLTYLPQLFVANNSLSDSADLIHIKNADSEKDYYCPICAELVKSRALNSKKMQPHYYHVNSSCDRESQIHWLYKYIMFKTGGQFYIEDELYTVQDIEIEKSYETSFGRYQPDITVYTTDGKKFFFELYFTNRKDEDYACKWQELDTPVVEVKLKEYIYRDLTEIPRFEYLYNNGTFYQKEYHKNNLYASTIGAYKEELRRQDYLNYKATWEKLDWYYRELKRYLNGELTEKEIAAVFSSLSLEDMYPCYENIRRTNCVKHLKDFFNELINTRVNTLISEKIHSKNPDVVVKFVHETARTDRVDIILPYDGDYICGDFKLDYKISYSSKVHRLSNDDVLNPLFNICSVLDDNKTRAEETEKELQKLYEDTGIRGCIDRIKYTPVNYGYYGGDYFYGLISFDIPYEYKNKKYICNTRTIIQKTFYINDRYTDYYFGNSLIKREKIAERFTKDFFDNMIQNKIQSSYLSEAETYIRDSKIQEKVQENINKVFENKNNKVFINCTNQANNFLDIRMYLNQMIIADEYLKVEFNNGEVITNISNEELVKTLYQKTKEKCNEIADMISSTKTIYDYIISKASKSWSIEMGCSHLRYCGYGLVEPDSQTLSSWISFNFKNQQYKRHSFYPEKVIISLDISEREIYKDLVNGILELFRRTESHGLGLYSPTWWMIERDNKGKIGRLNPKKLLESFLAEEL